MTHTILDAQKRHQLIGGGLVAKLCPTLVILWTVACQAPLSMGFSSQEYQSGLPCPPPGNLSDPGIELTSPALADDSLPLSHLGSLKKSPILPSPIGRQTDTHTHTQTHTHRHTHTLGSYIKALNVASALEDIYCTSQDWLYLLLAHNQNQILA